MLTEARLEDRLHHQFQRHLRYAVSNRRYPQRPRAAIGFGDQYPPHRAGPVGLVLQFAAQLQQVAVYPYSVLYGRKGDPVYAGTTLVAQDPPPGVTEDVCPIQFVVECVARGQPLKAVGRLLLGLNVELPL